MFSSCLISVEVHRVCVHVFLPVSFHKESHKLGVTKWLLRRGIRVLNADSIDLNSASILCFVSYILTYAYTVLLSYFAPNTLISYTSLCTQ